MKIRFLFLSVFFVFLSGCAQNMYQVNDSKFIVHGDKLDTPLISLSISKERLKYNNLDSCVIEAFRIKDNFDRYGSLFIESIDLDSSCAWNGLARGYFEQLFSEKEKINSIKLIDRIDSGHYEFSQYLINKTYKINLIYIWGMSESIFILDENGTLTNEMFKKLQISKEFYIERSEIFKFKGNYTLVEDNWYKYYFKKDAKNSDELTE